MGEKKGEIRLDIETKQTTHAMVASLTIHPDNWSKTFYAKRAGDERASRTVIREILAPAQGIGFRGVGVSPWNWRSNLLSRSRLAATRMPTSEFVAVGQARVLKKEWGGCI